MKKSFFSILIIAGLLVGCAVRSGNENLAAKNMSTITQKIIKGKTTKAQIKALLGDPQTMGNTPDGKTFWTYTYMKASPTASSYIPIIGAFTGGAKSKIKSLTIYFDKNGIVKNYNFMNTSQTSHLSPF